MYVFHHIIVVRKIHMVRKPVLHFITVPPFCSGILTLQFVPTNMLDGTLTELIPYLGTDSLYLDVELE